MNTKSQITDLNTLVSEFKKANPLFCDLAMVTSPHPLFMIQTALEWAGKELKDGKLVDKETA